MPTTFRQRAFSSISSCRITSISRASWNWSANCAARPRKAPGGRRRNEYLWQDETGYTSPSCHCVRNGTYVMSVVATMPAVTIIPVAVADTIHDAKLVFAKLGSFALWPEHDDRGAPQKKGEEPAEGNDDPVVEHAGSPFAPARCTANRAFPWRYRAQERTWHV